MRAGRVLEDTITNYTLATKNYPNIPIICVVTGCENIEPMKSWVDENKKILENHNLKYSAVVATCFAGKGGRMGNMLAKLVKDSVDSVWSVIVDSVYYDCN